MVHVINAQLIGNYFHVLQHIGIVCRVLAIFGQVLTIKWNIHFFFFFFFFFNIGLHLVALVSEKIYNTMSVTYLSLPGKSPQQRFVVMNVTLSNWYWDVYKNVPQPQLGGPITPIMSPHHPRGHHAHLCLQILSSR